MCLQCSCMMLSFHGYPYYIALDLELNFSTPPRDPIMQYLRSKIEVMLLILYRKKEKYFTPAYLNTQLLIHTYLLFFQVRSNNLENSCNKHIFFPIHHHTLKIYWELMTSKSKTNSSLLIIFSDRSGITIEIIQELD